MQLKRNTKMHFMRYFCNEKAFPGNYGFWKMAVPTGFLLVKDQQCTKFFSQNKNWIFQRFFEFFRFLVRISASQVFPGFGNRKYNFLQISKFFKFPEIFLIIFPEKRSVFRKSRGFCQNGRYKVSLSIKVRNAKRNFYSEKCWKHYQGLHKPIPSQRFSRTFSDSLSFSDHVSFSDFLFSDLLYPTLLSIFRRKIKIFKILRYIQVLGGVILCFVAFKNLHPWKYPNPISTQSGLTITGLQYTSRYDPRKTLQKFRISKYIFSLLKTFKTTFLTNFSNGRR